MQTYIRKQRMVDSPKTITLGAESSGDEIKRARREFKHFRQLADDGDARARYITGIHLLRGHGTHISHPQALEYLTSAGEQGEMDAQYALANMYGDGHVVAKDQRSYHQWIIRAADSGHTDAAYRLSKSFRFGTEGVAPNMEQSVHYLKAAAAGGHQGAIRSMQHDAALISIVESADQGNPDDMFRMGNAYQAGCDIGRNEYAAAKWYQRAAKSGHAPSMFALSEQIRNGLIDHPKREADTWLEAAAVKDHAAAQYELGMRHWQTRDDAQGVAAIEWFTKAATNGHTAAAQMLACIFRDGQQGTKLDAARAEHWNQMALKTGRDLESNSEIPTVNPGLVVEVADTQALVAVDVNKNTTENENTPKPPPIETSASEGSEQAKSAPKSITIVLVDTNVLLDDPDVIPRIIANKGIPCVTSVVLGELDGLKKSEDPDVVKAAKHLFRELAKSKPTRVDKVPGGGKILDGDVFQTFDYLGTPILVVERDQNAMRVNNDARIMAVAKDYGMVVITRDAAFKVRAQSQGIETYLWIGPRGVVPPNKNNSSSTKISAQDPSKANRKPPGSSTRNSVAINQSSEDGSQRIKAFAIRPQPLSMADSPLTVGHLPAVGEAVSTDKGPLRLVKVISAGGEGTIFETDQPTLVCKIYHRDCLTQMRKRKVELMLTRKIIHGGLCWPIAQASNAKGEFIGYVMPRAKGRPMQTTMFIKPLLEKNFPEWTRIDLVNLCLGFLEKVSYLHRLNVFIGDINPLNLLVTDESNWIGMVDTDSFQIEDFPCPVGTVNFTPPEIQGVPYGSFLRTLDHELFAVATMLFMILHPGKPPYAQQGGGDPAANIRSRQFAYPFEGNRSDKTPQGPWQFIWANLPHNICEAFYKVFASNERVSVKDWQALLRTYRGSLTRGFLSNDLFPTTFKIRDPIDVICSNCQETVVASERRVETMRRAGKEYCCGKCVATFRLRILANKAREVHRTVKATSTGSSWSWLAAPSVPPPITPRATSSGQTSKPVSKPARSPARSSSNSGNGLIVDVAKAIWKLFK